MYPRTGAWTMAQSIAKLEADVTQLKLALRTKVITFTYLPNASNSAVVTFTLPADIKTDTVQDIYDLFVEKNDYYLKLPCTGHLMVNGVYCYNLYVSASIPYPGGNISGLTISGNKLSDNAGGGFQILPENFPNVTMHVVII